MTFGERLSAFRRYYMEVIEPIGRVMSFLILTCLWLVVFGLYALIMKILRLLRITKPPVTGWHPVAQDPPEHMHYQF